MTNEAFLRTFQAAYDALPRPLTTPNVRALARSFHRDLKTMPLKDVHRIIERLLEENAPHYTTIAYQWADAQHRRTSQDTIHTYDHWVRTYLQDWWDTDDFLTHAFHRHYQDHPCDWDWILPWTTHENFPVRRAAAVAHVVLARRGTVHLDHVRQICDALLEDPHHLVQKGYGWLLKETSIHHPDWVVSYLKQHAHTMPRTAFRYAIERFDEPLRSSLLQQGR
jgi:3-methyladenine DNA glycosylase AlkD